MMRFCIVLTLLAVSLAAMSVAADAFQWPGNAKVAISLSYDDALESQLDNAIPALDKYGIKASFYPTLSSPVVAERMGEWRKLAQAGHELGNHSLFHPCSASKPGRSWVLPRRNLDQRTVEQMREEVATANAFLKALDSRDERTYTPPCLDSEASDGDYLAAIADDFVGIKAAEGFPQDFSVLLMPDGHSGKELIEFVKTKATKYKIIHLLFHGVGGDYMSVSPKAHKELVKYLASNGDIYWTDTYLNIMTHIRSEAPELLGERH